jgi:hypothetical protein
MGVASVRATCECCQDSAIIGFDDIRLADTTLFSEIVASREFACLNCGSRAIKLSPDWDGQRRGANARLAANRAATIAHRSGRRRE